MNEQQPRIAIVCDRDFGSLGLALIFISSPNLARDITLLLPDPVYSHNADVIRCDVRRWSNAQDLNNALREIRPRFTVLMSAYLYPPQRLMSISQLKRLIADIRSLGSEVATTDPSLGVMSTFRSTDIDASILAISHPDIMRATGILSRYVSKLLSVRLAYRMRNIATLLNRVPHLYAGQPTWVENVRTFSFFDPGAVTHPMRLIHADSENPASGHDQTPTWLFVLAQFDLAYQLARFGEQAFIAHVGDRIEDAMGFGKQVVLVAPEPLISGIRKRFPQNDVLRCVTRLPYDQFGHYLVQSEIVFYWQMFSTSSFTRILNQQTTCYFDRGHYVRLIPETYERGINAHYASIEPRCLDVASRLEPSPQPGLSESDMRRVLDHFMSFERPSEVISAMCSKPNQPP